MVSLCILCFTREAVKLYECRPAGPSNTDGFERQLRLVPSLGKLIKPLKKESGVGPISSRPAPCVRRLLEEGLDFWFGKTGDPRLNF